MKNSANSVRQIVAGLVLFSFSLVRPGLAQDSENLKPFVGTWAFELPDGNPAWLGVFDAAEGPSASLLWSVGNPRTVNDLQVAEGKLTFKRNVKWRPYGNPKDVWVLKQPITVVHDGDGLTLYAEQTALNAPEQSPQKIELVGTKMPPMPPRPDLAQVKFSTPIQLFDGKTLQGWKLSNPDKKNGWRAEDGVLINETPKTDFSAYGEFGNLVTERSFGDFRLSIEYNVEKNANSGIYLRGTYEAQVVDRDSRMQGRSGPGAIFGRITPSENAGNPGGEWNKYVLTLVDRHISVQLNGKLVIDNQPLMGCTGGGINADDTKPGPIFLQGDHTSVLYRNIILEPVAK
ncbi:MAG: DUF1080 domain-containing protein [Planctomycetota bacterium]